MRLKVLLTAIVRVSACLCVFRRQPVAGTVIAHKTLTQIGFFLPHEVDVKSKTEFTLHFESLQIVGSLNSPLTTRRLTAPFRTATDSREEILYRIS